MYQQEEASADIRALLGLVHKHPEAVLTLKTLQPKYMKAQRWYNCSKIREVLSQISPLISRLFGCSITFPLENMEDNLEATFRESLPQSYH